MNDNKQTALQSDLQLIDLGDAKALTLGIPFFLYLEDNPIIPLRPIPSATRVD